MGELANGNFHHTQQMSAVPERKTKKKILRKLRTRRRSVIYFSFGRYLVSHSKKDSRGYEQVSVSSGVRRTGCWHEYKSLRKDGINFILKPIDKLDHRCAEKMFNFNFVCIAVVQNS